MKNLMILVKMQLKEQFNFKRLEVDNVSKFQIFVSALAALLKFALVTAICVAFLLVAKLLGLFSVSNQPIPSTVISLVFIAMLFTSVISCIIGLTKSLYYARDNAVLLTLPCLPVQVYLSKLIIFFIFEIKRNFSFLIPLFIAYYATHGYAWTTYPWMLFCMIIISLFSVSVGALFSIPAMWIANFFRQQKWLQISGLVVIVTSAIVALFYGISLIPENIDLLATWNTTYWKIQDFLKAYSVKCAPIYHLTLVLLGETKNMTTTFPILLTFGRFGLILGIALVLLAAGFFIVRPLFYKMASTPFEYLKKKVKPKPNVLRTRRVAAVYNEFLIAFKTPNRIFANVGILVSIPMLTFLLNKIFLAMNTREMGDYMVVAFNVLIILLVALNANCYASSIFSREGRSSYLIKTQPSKYPILILAKLLPNTVFVLVSLTATYVILLRTTPIGITNTTILMLAVGMTYLAHMLYSADQDLMNPQIELYATVGASESNKNEMRSTVTAFSIAFIAAIIIFVLLLEGVGFNVYIKYIVIAFAVLLYRVKIFFSNLRVYYKEK